VSEAAVANLIAFATLVVAVLALRETRLQRLGEGRTALWRSAKTTTDQWVEPESGAKPPPAAPTPKLRSRSRHDDLTIAERSALARERAARHEVRRRQRNEFLSAFVGAFLYAAIVSAVFDKPTLRLIFNSVIFVIVVSISLFYHYKFRRYHVHPLLELILGTLIGVSIVGAVGALLDTL
jgi:hypothetical protein